MNRIERAFLCIAIAVVGLFIVYELADAWMHPADQAPHARPAPRASIAE